MLGSDRPREGGREGERESERENARLFLTQQEQSRASLNAERTADAGGISPQDSGRLSEST